MPAEKRHITRNRTSYSCQTCRRRKVRCDKQHPICGTCKKTDEDCIYGEDEPTTQQPEQAKPAREAVRKRKYSNHEILTSTHPPELIDEVSVETRLESIQELLKQVQAIVGKDPTIFQAITSGNVENSQSQSTVHPEHSGHSRNGGPITAKDRQQTDDESTRVNNGPAAERDSSQSNATTLTADISGRLANLNFLFMTPKASNAVLAANGASIDPLSVMNSCSPSVTADPDASESNVSTDMPLQNMSREHCNVLFRTWLVSVYAVLPIVDPFTLKEHFDAFDHWHNYSMDKGLANPVEQELPLIYAVMYGGVLGLSVRGMRRWFRSMPRKLVLSVLRTRFLDQVRRTKPSANVIAAEVMMKYMCHGRPGISEAASQLAVLIRHAQLHGLHRSPSSNTSLGHSELVTRLWWEIVYIDSMHSTTANLPSLLDPHFFDEVLPSELKESHRHTPAARTYENSVRMGTTQPAAPDEPFDDDQLSFVSVHNLVCRTRAIATVFERKIARIILGAKPIQPTDITDLRAILVDFRAQLHAVVNRIPVDGEPELGNAPAPQEIGQSVSMDHGTYYGGDLQLWEIHLVLGKSVSVGMKDRPFQQQIELAKRAFCKWARVALSVQLDQVSCFAFGPFVRSPETMLWSLIRTCALEACHNFFRRYIMLATTLEFERFRWTWSSMFQPVHAAKIVLTDVHELPFSNTAIRSRALFDKVLLLCLPQYGMVGGDYGLTFMGPFEQAGPEICGLLMELRMRAWRKAGLDPNYLWTEDDQLQVAFNLADPTVQRPPQMVPVRPTQLKVPPLLNEGKWNLFPPTLASPFEGLNELIQKIKASSSSSGSKLTQSNAHDHSHTPDMNSAGDHTTRSSTQASHDLLANTNTQMNNFKNTSTKSRANKAAKVSNVDPPRERASFQADGESSGNNTSMENTSVYLTNGKHLQADVTLSWSTAPEESPVDTTGHDTNMEDQTTSGSAYGAKSYISPDPIQENSEPSILNGELDFDWDRWDSLFGNVGSSNIQDVGNSDPQMFVDVFKDSYVEK